MSELGKDAKTPDVWRMSALLELCPKDMKAQMMLRLDEIVEHRENRKTEVVSCTANKAEQARGGQKEMYVPMTVDHVSGGKFGDEDWGDVARVRRGTVCYN